MDQVKRANPFRTALDKLLKNKLAVVCLIILLAEILMVIFAPYITSFNYSDQDPSIRLRPGFWAKWTEVTDPNAALTSDAIAAKELTLRAGKKNFRKLVLG